MYSLLLKKTLPFALTFILGSLVGGLFKAAGIGASREPPARFYYHGYGEGRSCPSARRRNLVAESRPLNVLFQPEARAPRESGDAEQRELGPVTMSVTFGADGKVQEVNPPAVVFNPVAPSVWRAAERAARRIEFEPETVNGVPVTVTREVAINFAAE